MTDSGEVSQGACPIQVIFCLKEQNKKKLNSHRWFFNAFGPLIKPNGKSWTVSSFLDAKSPLVCILLDVGTKPTGNSIYELWKGKTTAYMMILRLIHPHTGFDKHSGVGGACGEYVVRLNQQGSLS